MVGDTTDNTPTVIEINPMAVSSSLDAPFLQRIRSEALKYSLVSKLFIIVLFFLSKIKYQGLKYAE